MSPSRKTPPPARTGDGAGTINHAPPKYHAAGPTQGRFSYDLLDDLRRRLPDYLAASGIEMRRNGNRLVGLCPVHADTDPSFAVFGTDHTRAGCYPCGWQGDIFALAQWTGRAGDFPEAVRHVASVLGTSTRDDRHGQAPHRESRPTPAPRVTTPKPAALAIPELPDGFEDACTRARTELFNACRRRNMRAHAVARELGTDLRTLESLTFTTDAVGIVDGGCILYLYETGIKLRRPRGGTGPRFKWLHGRAVLPWRWHFAARANVRTVYVTEGESDCIAAIASGLEVLHPKYGETGSAVVACPGTSFTNAWGRLFKGKNAVLLFDADEPGQNAARQVARIIAPHAASVKIANWKGLGA